MSPAWSAVLRNVLVSREWHVILSWYVSPIPSSRSRLNIFVWLWANNVARSQRWGFSFTSRFSQESLRWFWLCSCWWSSISNIISPGINWNRPMAKTFNTHIISSSNNLEESFFTPVWSPRVSSNPIGSTILEYTPSDNANRVISVVLISCGIVEKSTSVIQKCLGHSHTAFNRTSLIYFIHHVLFTT